METAVFTAFSITSSYLFRGDSKERGVAGER
jgi:hypothetical protein